VTASDDDRIKNLAVRLALRACRWHFRYGPWRASRSALWRFSQSHLNWRHLELNAHAEFGAEFTCRVNDLIQSYIFHFGVWEPNLTDFISRRLRPGDTFIDVGANVGYFSLLGSKLVGPSGRVVSIEASPRIFDALTRHLAMNRCTNIRAANVAVADGSGIVDVFEGPDYNLGGTTTVIERGGKREATVQAEPLEVILSEEERMQARLIKIDIEGGEGPVLDRLAKTVDAFNRHVEIVAELSPATHKSGDAEFLRRFAASGFNVYRIQNDYSAAGYVSRQPRRPPSRIPFPLPPTQLDVVLSRHDADVL
jgi:FkbM family methyltransferase